MSVTVLILIVFIGGLVGGILLQIFLSKKSNKFFGLILPLVSFLYSLLVMLNVIVMDSMTVWEVFRVLAATFIMSNIPTIVLLVIYFTCKEKIKKMKQIEKMNIQDLN